jgi:hypothetical protein
MEIKERCQVEISNRFAALGNLDNDDWGDDVNINRSWKILQKI